MGEVDLCGVLLISAVVILRAKTNGTAGLIEHLAKLLAFIA